MVYACANLTGVMYKRRRHTDFNERRICLLFSVDRPFSCVHLFDSSEVELSGGRVKRIQVAGKGHWREFGAIL